jgi:hypothetical protein
MRGSRRDDNPWGGRDDESVTSCSRRDNALVVASGTAEEAEEKIVEDEELTSGAKARTHFL